MVLIKHTSVVVLESDNTHKFLIVFPMRFPSVFFKVDKKQFKKTIKLAI